MPVRSTKVSEYASFFKSPLAARWKRVGARRRAGVAAPLFSLHSKESIGIGELPDLELLIDWCEQAGLGILQLLPMNDVGFNFRPYDSESCFALEPAYLSLSRLTQADTAAFKNEIAELKRRFPAGRPRVDYGIKKAKLELLWMIFQQTPRSARAGLARFSKKEAGWLEPYVHFKVLKEEQEYRSWEQWPDPWKKPDASALGELSLRMAERLEFHRWMQWQLYLQFRAVSQYARAKNVLILGDLPFLVSRDSADVWANQDYFKLDLKAGAPPDLLFAEGQQWGMPPYRWDNIAAADYDYLAAKLRYAENFYDLFRIDHFVGVFRVWVFPENGTGVFDPPNEPVWEDHGRRIVEALCAATTMLPCAEDLGTVPECSNRLLNQYAIPGMDVQRWTRDWGATEEFKPPAHYRKNSVAVLSTHDISPFRAWWKYEAGTVDESLFRKKCETRGFSFEETRSKLFDPETSSHGRLRWRKGLDLATLMHVLGRPSEEIRDFRDLYKGTIDEKEKFLYFTGLKPGASDSEVARGALARVNETTSIFSVQLLQDWLPAETLGGTDLWEFRVNFPGTTSDKNWSAVLPFSLEKLLGMRVETRRIRSLVARSGRHPS